MKNLISDLLAPAVIATLIATGMTSITASSALAEDMHPGKKLAITAFESVDDKERGFIDMGEFNAYGENVFVSMDANDDGNVDVDEFLEWDIGMKPIAEEAGAADAFKTAMRVVHSFWDRNGDGQMSRSEHRSSTIYDFQRADLDGDAVLTSDEFVNGFTVMKAARAAIAPNVK